MNFLLFCVCFDRCLVLDVVSFKMRFIDLVIDKKFGCYEIIKLIWILLICVIGYIYIRVIIVLLLLVEKKKKKNCLFDLI